MSTSFGCGPDVDHDHPTPAAAVSCAARRGHIRPAMTAADVVRDFEERRESALADERDREDAALAEMLFVDFLGGGGWLRRMRRRWADRYAFPDLVVVGREIPDVGECHLHRDGSTCAQCDGRHQHEWHRCVVLSADGYFIGDATRCAICGARKCDVPGCQGRRHHRDAHVYASGRVEAVGG